MLGSLENIHPLTLCVKESALGFAHLAIHLLSHFHSIMDHSVAGGRVSAGRVSKVDRK